MKIKKNIALVPVRKKWPFINMKIGDTVEIKIKKAWPQASKYAHVVATKKKWQMHTVWLGKFGHIQRVK